MARRQLLHAAQRGEASRAPLIGEIARERVVIECPVEVGHRQQRLDLGGEDEAARRLSV